MAFGVVMQSPMLDRVEQKMRELGTGSFLGSDSRKLYQILDADQDAIDSLALSHRSVADRLQGITRHAKDRLGDPVVVEDRFEVTAMEVRGRIPCPWGHKDGLFSKSHVKLREMATGRELIWTDLSIHLIHAHGFYQGKGSPYRMDPETVKKVLFSPEAGSD